MFHFEQCKNVPERGGRECGGGGLVQVEGRVVWGGGGARVYSLDDKDKWKKWTDGVKGGATLGVCGGSLLAAGGVKDNGYSKEVMVWRGGRWSLMPNMLVGCAGSCVVSVGGGGLVVMGGVDDGHEDLATVQVFNGKTSQRPGLHVPLLTCQYTDLALWTITA